MFGRWVPVIFVVGSSELVGHWLISSPFRVLGVCEVDRLISDFPFWETHVLLVLLLFRPVSRFLFPVFRILILGYLLDSLEMSPPPRGPFSR